MKLITMSLSSSIVILLVLILRKLFMNKLSKKMVASLWFIALFSLLVPLSIPIKITLPQTVDHIAPLIMREYTHMELTVPILADGLRDTNAGVEIPFPTIIKGLWFAGAATCGFCFAFIHARDARKYRESLPVDGCTTRRIQELCSEIDPTRVRFSDYCTTPLVFGVWKPVILLPYYVKEIANDEMQYILLHEYVHFRRMDIWKKLLYIVALCMHWFNPFVWLMFYYANHDMELSCDEAVLTIIGITEAQKRAYAATLIALEERITCAPSSVGFSNHPLKERIISIMKMQKKKKSSCIFGTIALLAVTLTILTVHAAPIDVEEAPSKTMVTPSEVSVDSIETPAQRESEVPSDSVLVVQTTQDTGVRLFVETVSRVFDMEVHAENVNMIDFENELWSGPEKMFQYKADKVAVSGVWNDEAKQLIQITKTNANITDAATAAPKSSSDKETDYSSLAEEYLLNYNPDLSIEHCSFTSGGTVNSQKALWYWLVTEDNVGYYVIVGEASGELVGIREFPAGFDPRNNRG